MRVSQDSRSRHCEHEVRSNLRKDCFVTPLRGVPRKDFFNCLKFLSFLVFWFFGFSVFAQDEFLSYDQIKLYLGQPAMVSAYNPKRVAVARPEIADVASVSNSEVIIQPKSVGITSLTVWDDYGQQDYQLKVLSEDLTQVKLQADSLIRELNLPNIRTKISEAEGKIILLGETEDINQKERLLSALGSIKDKLLDLAVVKEERNLVRIDMQILEMDRTDTQKLGFDHKDSTLLSDGASKAMNKITEMFATSKWTRAALDTTINHLVSVGKVKILSKPKLVCLSGKEAEFTAGGQYPIISTTVTATAGTSSSSTTFKDFGITMKIKPVVKDEEDIQISISNEITEIDSSVTVSGSTPAFSTRNTKTELYLKNEQSLVMSGLIKNTETNTVEKFPGLAEIPVLGMLFRSKNFQNKQTELVIILTPSIEEGSPVFKKKDRLEKKDLGEISGRQRYPERVLVEAPDADEEAVNYLAEEPAPKEGIAHYLEEIKAQAASSLVSSRTAAREFGYTGTLKLRLRIFSDGTLKDISVLSSSGSELVDSSAIFAIKNLAPFPSFPLSVERKEISLDIPVVFN